MQIVNQFAVQLLKTAAGIGSAYYPETLGVYLVVNAPGFFPFAWRLVKGFLDEKTQRSVKVVNKAEQYQTLSELIDEENIPTFLGGKCTC